MIDSHALLVDLKKQLKLLEADLRQRAVEPGLPWAEMLRAEHAAASARERTALTWSEWSKGEVSQAAVAWIIACTFIRFAEDNDLLLGARDCGAAVPLPWIAGEGERLDRAIENQSAYYAAEPSMNSRDWLQQAFGVLASLPAGKGLVDRAHNPVWVAPISAMAADALVDFWRQTDSDGGLIHGFVDPGLDTRFLGDLYQDLSEYAKKTFALLQTPVFIEEFILDYTLVPAMAEFGLEGLKLIDPTCGSGHFLLGAFERLDQAWREHAPAMDARTRVQKALDSIHGVDLNPFAIAIARFRLTVAALKASGEKTFVAAPAFGYKLAVGDSLLKWHATGITLDIDPDDEVFAYASEDVREYSGILDTGQYHVVVGNPPYITVKDKALKSAYRELYPSCSGAYALTIPFLELFFELARPESDSGGGGYVGKITSNSFMKREFGKKVIENLLSGTYTPRGRVDLTAVIDTSGTYIPGHGTPTVILIGRSRKPVLSTVRAVLGVRGEPGQPEDPAQGLVWRDIVDHVDQPGYNGAYVSITDTDRGVLAHHPWSLAGGGAAELFGHLTRQATSLFEDRVRVAGRYVHTGQDDAYFAPNGVWRTQGIKVSSVRPLVEGNVVRDWALIPRTETLFPYDESLKASLADEAVARKLWCQRSLLITRREPGGTHAEVGLTWYEFSRWHPERYSVPLGITFAEVATHNHFVLDRGGKVFKQTAPVIKLPATSTEDEHFELLGVLNSSVACFWLKQVSHNKGSTVDSLGARQTQLPWENFFQFAATKLRDFPLPQGLPGELGRAIDSAAGRSNLTTPSAIFSTGAPNPAELEVAHDVWRQLRNDMAFLQEELDWETYRLYELIDEDLTYSGKSIPIGPEQRSFEIELGRAIGRGLDANAWFERHHRSPITEIPTEWPEDYRSLVQRRLDATASDPQLALLEQPEYKRRWATPSWESQVAEAATTFALDRLERAELWHDAQGRPVARSVVQLADLSRNDTDLRTALEILTGSPDFALEHVLAALLTESSVPQVAAQRYKPSGLTKFREWQRVWDLQRAEDRGEGVIIPVPPKFAPVDFLKTSFWKARGKLDVPKERFLSYPGASRNTDDSAIYGWAGWDHAARGLALAVLVGDMTAGGASTGQITPLLAGLVELEPWLRQWHGEVDPAFGTSPADAISGILNAQLDHYSLTRDEVTGWLPTSAPRGRGRAASAASTNPLFKEDFS